MCGALNMACCAGQVCQSGGVCAAADGGMACLACGASGQRCCGTGANNGCGTGLACVDPGAGPAMCEACGARGQACCGSGTVATGTCNTGLSCANVQGMGIICIMP